MISTAMRKALNEQINKELYSAYVYLAMAGLSAERGLKGIGRWFELQYHEEVGHGLKIFHYLIDQNAPVKLDAVRGPSVEFRSPLAVFERVLKHECEVSASIHALMDLALKEKDHATHTFLGWFATEQVEEEAQAQEIIDRLKIIEKEGTGLLLLDMDLGKRGGEAAGGGES